MSELWKQLGLLGIIVVAIVAVLTLFGAWPSTQQTSSGNSLPAITASEQQQLQQMPVFQHLVSYTNSGFQPSRLTVKKGETVRFTNNSSQNLWVASIGSGGGKVYPGTSSCDGSAFDSCEALNPGDFWEFTFTQSGMWSFLNNLDKGKMGAITVSGS